VILFETIICWYNIISATTPHCFKRLPSGESEEFSPDADRSPDTGLDDGTEECCAARHNSASSYSDSCTEEPTVTSLHRYYSVRSSSQFVQALSEE
jgi:hypothetical protein